MKNTPKRWAASGNQRYLSDQQKEALGHAVNFQNKLSSISNAANVSLTKRQVDVVVQSPALQVAVQVQENIISIQDTHDALLGGFRAVVQVSEAIGHVFKAYEQQFSAIAEVANNIGRTVKTVGEWHSQVVERGNLLGHQLQVVGENFKLIAESISLQSPNTNPEIYPVRATYREASVSVCLERDQVEEIAELAAHLVLGKLEEKLLLSLKPLSDQPSIAPALEITAPSLTSTALTEKKGVQWGGILIDLDHATLQYKENPAIEIVPKNAEIKWLLCVLRKEGEVAEHTEIAVATGIITDQQSDKTNQAVARRVQFIRKRVVLVLKSAGMTPAEIKQMLLSKPGIGYAARSINNHTHAA